MKFMDNESKNLYGDLDQNLYDLSRDSGTYKSIVDICMKNFSLQDQSEYSLEDHNFSFLQTDNVEYLEMYFNHGNWAIRNGIIYKDLAFVQQKNRGDEWLVLKHNTVSNQWVPFIAISITNLNKYNHFFEWIEKAHYATVEQCKRFL